MATPTTTTTTTITPTTATSTTDYTSPTSTSTSTTTTTPSPPPISISVSTLDLRNLTYLTPTDDNLQCPICHSPLLDPVTTNCRHTFCAPCIASSLEHSPSCPVDRKPLTPDGVSAAPIMVASLVNDLLVLCPNAELGCPTTCARYLLAGHLRDACGFVEVKCSGCDDLVLRKDAAEEDCMHQVLDCAYCFESFRRIDMEAHEAHCPQILAECPYCTTEQTRATITAHIATCPSAPTACSASTIGCPWAGARRDLPAHASICAFTLLRPVLAAHTARLETLELENRALRRKIDILLPPGRGGGGDDDDGPVYDDQTIQLLTEQEHLRGDVERLSASLGEMEIKQSMLLMNETLRTKEEMAGMRAAINGMRMQIHWLLTARMQRAAPGPGERAEGGRRVEGAGAGAAAAQGDRVKL